MNYIMSMSMSIIYRNKLRKEGRFGSGNLMLCSSDSNFGKMSIYIFSLHQSNEEHDNFNSNSIQWEMLHLIISKHSGTKTKFHPRP